MCHICDYLSTSAILMRTGHLSSIINSESFNLNLLQMFLSLKSQIPNLQKAKKYRRYGQQSVLCNSADPIVVQGQLQPVNFFSRQRLSKIATIFDFNSIQFQQHDLKKVKYNFQLASLGCKKYKGYILTKSCFDELLTSLYLSEVHQSSS